MYVDVYQRGEEVKIVVSVIIIFRDRVVIMFNFFSKNKTNQMKRVYLDHAGATEMSELSKSALITSLATFGNASGIHREGAEASVLLDKARALCATSLNAHAYEIYFTSSGTESCNMAVLGTYKTAHASWGENKKDGLPHIITSAIEHPAVLEPIRLLKKEGKVRVTYLSVNEDGSVKVKDLREALSKETVLISIMYANNEVGTLQPVKEIGRAIDEWKKENERSFTEFPYFHTDACQAANYCNLDVLRLKCHLMTVNASKCYGGKGAALLYKREGLRLDTITQGGGQERGLRSGTENVPACYAFGVALQEAGEMRDVESKRLRMLRDETVDMLKKALPGIVFYGAFDVYNNHDGRHSLHEEKRLPNNINCRVPGISSEEMILRLDAKGFAVSHKSACASMETDGSYVLQALGATEEEAKENIRISMGRLTTSKDMVSLVDAMREIAGKYRV